MYKVCCVIVGIALFLPLWALAQPSPNSAAGTLAAMRGKSRPLLIFYPQSPGDRPLGRQLQVQRAMFDGHSQELEERDVVVMFVPYSIFAKDYEPRQITPNLPDSPDLYGALRVQFHIEDSKFAVVLLGKDGGEKFRSHETVTIEKLDALIDAMPMRQQEVRDGQHAK